MPAWTRYLGIGVLAAGLLATPALMAAPAEALPMPGPGVPCVAPPVVDVPEGRRIRDTPAVSAATLARVDREVAASDEAPLAEESARAAALSGYRVKVRIHVIHGRHKGEGKLQRRGARKKVFRILRSAYNAGQSADSEQMGIDFVLKQITITRNEQWFHARPMSRADRQMKRKLHGGNAQTLNIYVNKPRFPNGGVLLGYARFPWQRAARPRLDGVTVNVAALPGGRASGYNQGDTVVHETGHWLGLLHTFEGGPCDAENDYVADTPAERNPNFRCVDATNLCDPTQVMPVGTFHDPALNFMNYSFDSCMRMFTAGQHQRFADYYSRYRFGR